MTSDIPYLTEHKLVEFCRQLWLGDDILVGKAHPEIRRDLKRIIRPDLINLTKKVVVEFDGHQHYTKAAQVAKDLEKDALYSRFGYKVIRWPYFVQLEERSVWEYFGVDVDLPQVYPHGFIADAVVLPADFCVAGLRRFDTELSRFGLMSIGKDICASLVCKIACSGLPASCVFPLREDCERVTSFVSVMSSASGEFEHNYS